jgi:hypothetical protein
MHFLCIKHEHSCMSFKNNVSSILRYWICTNIIHINHNINLCDSCTNLWKPGFTWNLYKPMKLCKFVMYPYFFFLNNKWPLNFSLPFHDFFIFFSYCFLQLTKAQKQKKEIKQMDSTSKTNYHKDQCLTTSKKIALTQNCIQ